ncbi:MAG: radical SAM protein [Planctomycetota bacterium]|jgi:MoaA/NifB/PqqE/SkfB family radical SAM enzyme
MGRVLSLLKDLQQRCSDAGHPLSATLEVTHRCNLRCRHCYLCDHHQPPQPEMTLAEITDLFDQLVDLQTLFLTLTGGEFFVREDAYEILDAARARGFVINLFTNGTLIHPEGIERIAAALPRQVHVSILGLEELHDHIAQQSGAFQQAIETMDRLRAHEVQVVAKIILTRDAIPQLDALKALAENHADHRVISADLVPTIDNAPVPKGMNPSCEDLCSIVAPEQLQRREPTRRPESAPICSAGRSLIAISPYGEVMPCIGLRKVVGTIREFPLKTLWQNDFFKELQCLTYGDLTACKDCEENRYCLFCPGRSWHECGDLVTPVPDVCERAAKIHALLNPQPVEADDG